LFLGFKKGQKDKKDATAQRKQQRKSEPKTDEPVQEVVENDIVEMVEDSD
jgi:hypothetical protein